jgi:hypothetical protein
MTNRTLLRQASPRVQLDDSFRRNMLPQSDEKPFVTSEVQVCPWRDPKVKVSDEPTTTCRVPLHDSQTIPSDFAGTRLRRPSVLDRETRVTEAVADRVVRVPWEPKESAPSQTCPGTGDDEKGDKNGTLRGCTPCQDILATNRYA